MGQSTDVPRRRRRHQPAGLLRTLRLPSLLVVLDMAHATLAFCPGAGLSTAVGTRYNRHVDDGQLVSLMSAFTGSAGEVGKVGGAQYARGGLTQTSMMASSVAPPRTKAEKKNEFFRAKKDRMVEFGSSQRVEVGAVVRCKSKHMRAIIDCLCTWTICQQRYNSLCMIECIVVCLS